MFAKCLFFDPEFAKLYLDVVVFLVENDLDFAGLNHAIFDWLRNYSLTNQN